MDLAKASEKLIQINQLHLLAYWDSITQLQQSELLKQIDALDINTYAEQQKLVFSEPAAQEPFSPFTDYSHAGSSTDAALLSQGMMGCLLLAGGQASRLRSEMPKGFYPVTLVKQKSLFQLFAEKTLAASRQAGRPLLLAIMTSPLNHLQTLAYFNEHHFFGLDSKQVSFFCQGMLPLLDEQGNLFLEAPYQIAAGPNGNGMALHEFYRSGIWQDWVAQGVHYLNVALIDNPLADPFDAELLRFHHLHKNEITLKCTSRKDTNDKVGVLVSQNHHCKVIEYTEFPKDEWEKKDSSGHLKHLCCNLSLFCLNMDFIKKICRTDIPLHLAKKTVKMLSPTGETVLPEKPNAWKFEKFIFDILFFSQNVKALLYPREHCYAPLKNYTGENSIQTVQEALLALDKEIFHRISGKMPPSTPFELSQEFHYPTPELLKKWKGKDFPNTDYLCE